MKRLSALRFGAVVAALLTLSGCATGNDLYAVTSRCRTRKCPTSGMFGPIPISGPSAADLPCVGAERLVDSFHSIRLDGLAEEVPLSYVCKAGGHSKGTASKGRSLAVAMLEPEIETCVVCARADRRVVTQNIVGFRIAIEHFNSTECGK